MLPVPGLSISAKRSTWTDLDYRLLSVAFRKIRKQSVIQLHHGETLQDKSHQVYFVMCIKVTQARKETINTRNPFAGMNKYISETVPDELRINLNFFYISVNLYIQENDNFWFKRSLQPEHLKGNKEQGKIPRELLIVGNVLQCDPLSFLQESRGHSCQTVHLHGNTPQFAKSHPCQLLDIRQPTLTHQSTIQNIITLVSDSWFMTSLNSPFWHSHQAK